MLTPHVTEILPAWRTARLARPPATQRELVMASLLGAGARREVYPVRPRTVVEPRL